MGQKQDNHPERHQTSGMDALKAFWQVLGAAPTGMQELTLVFGQRMIGNNPQIVSALADGTIIYSLTEMWQPGLERSIACYVLIQAKDSKRRGFAMPRNLREAMRHGEIRPPQSLVKQVVFRRGEDGGLYGFAANNKRVIVPAGSGVKITDQEIADKAPVAVIVMEKMTAFVAVARVKGKLAKDMAQPGGSSTALAVVEAAGGGMDALYATMVCVGNQYYDAASELGVDPTATRAQIKRAHKALADEYHPDKRLPAIKKLLRGTKPSAAQEAEITREFLVIQASYERLMLLADRADAVARYARLGVKALGRNIRDSQTGAEVYGFLPYEVPEDHGAEKLAAEGLRQIGYPELNEDAALGREVALTLAGWLTTELRKVKAVKAEKKSTAAKAEAGGGNGVTEAKAKPSKPAAKPSKPAAKTK